MSALSTRLQTGVQDLVNDLLAEDGGGMVEGFVTFVTYVDAEGESCFGFCAAPGQRVFLTAGMVDAMQSLTASQMHGALHHDD